jgi:1,2-diacylglycerol 3-alpha-glucosyltransferase
MKIAIFTDTFYPQINGVVTSIDTLAKGLSEKGHSVTVIAPKHKVAREEKRKYKVIRTRSVPALFYEDFKFTSPIDAIVFHKLNKEKIDIVHFMTPITVGSQAINYAIYKNLPLVGTFHTFFADEEYMKHIKLNYSLFKKVAWKYSNLYYNSCDLVTCPSEHTKKELKKNRCKREIKVISNGIDTKNLYFPGNKISFVKNATLDRNLLFVGRVAHEKSLDILIKATNIVTRSVNNVQLYIVGDGPQMKDMKKLVTDYHLSDNITFIGKVDHNDLINSDIYKKSELFVTASKTENQPMTILEAQANGLVCVGARARGMVDLIKDGHNGLLFEPDNIKELAQKITMLLGDKGMLKKFGKETLRDIKMHDHNFVISEWEHTYSGLIKAHKNTRRLQRYRKWLTLR